MSQQKRQAIAQRHQRIIDAARELAEHEGWAAVTTRRLSQLVGYSQPVLYTHFRSMQEVMDAVAIDGFATLAQHINAATEQVAPGRAAVAAALHSYAEFAAAQPAVFNAMFRTSKGLTFGAKAAAQQRAAFRGFERVIAPVAQQRGLGDSELVAEVIWAAIHGLSELGEAGRLRPAAAGDRLRLLTDLVTGGEVRPPEAATEPTGPSLI